jgi:dephospho-CoA kinase
LIPLNKKYVIGITGNIGSGKSLVRNMLERQGALGVDADAMAHRALLKGNPQYDEVIAYFGKDFLNADGEIDRNKLAKLVFTDKTALHELESILHPAVERAVHYLIISSPLPIVVIEAIKLLESNLVKLCDSIWLVDAPQKQLVARVIGARGMTRQQVQERMEQQSPAETKQQAAHVVIHNKATILDTWRTVLQEWQNLYKSVPEFKAAVEEAHNIIKKRQEYRVLNLDDFSLFKSFFTSKKTNHKFITSVPFTNLNDRFYDLARIQQLCEYSCIVRPAQGVPMQLSALRINNFCLQPINLISPYDFDLPIDLSSWLKIFEIIAKERSCETIMLTISSENYEIVTRVCAQGYEVLLPKSQMFGFWIGENSTTNLAGYNVLVKNLPRTVCFD